MKRFIKRYNRQLLITIAILIYMALFLFFYPPIYAIQDEADYLDFAYMLKEGSVYFDPLVSHKVVFNGKDYVNMYPPGMSILLLPFTYIHWKALFLLNFLLHILGFIFFVKSLKLLKIDIRYSLLYLFYPSFILYSRTLMPDAAIGSIVSAAIYFYLKDNAINKFISGLLFGFLGLIKNVVLIIPFMFFLCLAARYFIKQKYDVKKIEVVNFLSGISLFTVLAIGYNLIAFKNIISSAVAVGGILSIRYLPKHFIFYFLFLVTFYPLMFFAPLLYKQKNKFEFIYATLSFIILISLWSFIQTADGFFKKIVVGSRYTLAIMPIYLLTYADFLNRKFIKIKENFKIFIFAIGILLLAICAYLIDTNHQMYLKQQLYYRDTLYAHTPEGAFIVCNFQTKELLQEVWGNRKWLTFENAQLERYINSVDDFYIVSFLRKDKPSEFITGKSETETLVNKYKAALVKEIKSPYELWIYKVKK